MHYKTQCGTIKGTPNILDFSTYGDGFRVVEQERTRRESSVVVPFSDGVKDTSDGKKGPGTLTVTGKIYADGAAAAGSIDLIESTLLAQADGYYVWMEWDGADFLYYRVHHVQSVRHSYVDGWAGDCWEVSITWAMYDPEFGS